MQPHFVAPEGTPLAVGSVKRLHLQVGNQLYEENLYPLIFYWDRQFRFSYIYS